MGTGEGRARAALGAVARDLARLVVPVECPGCGLPDEVVCVACARHLAGPVFRCESRVPRLDRLDGFPPLPVWSVADYAGPLRGVVVAWKDRGRQDLTPLLTDAARGAGRDVGATLGGDGWPGPLHVVPVPTTTAARRRRGADLVAALAEAVVAGFRDGGAPAEVSAALRRRSAVDQVGLGARARGANTTGFRVRPGWAPTPGALLVLVDDVVTTGATLAACCRALERVGGPVLGAVVLAATPPPGRRGHEVEPIRDDTPQSVGRAARGMPG